MYLDVTYSGENDVCGVTMSLSVMMIFIDVGVMYPGQNVCCVTLSLYPQGAMFCCQHCSMFSTILNKLLSLN